MVTHRKSEKFKGVYIYNKPFGACKLIYATLTKNGTTWRAWFDTEREAALAYDKKRIELGLEPVNILKSK